MVGATTPGSVRINVLPKDSGSLAEAAKIIETAGGEVLGIGTYREPGQSRRGVYLGILGLDTAVAAIALRASASTVL